MEGRRWSDGASPWKQKCKMQLKIKHWQPLPFKIIFVCMKNYPA
jgi:hypothetical protein